LFLVPHAMGLDGYDSLVDCYGRSSSTTWLRLMKSSTVLSLDILDSCYFS
jgi:hypothetical protein